MPATERADGWVVADDPRDAAIRQMPDGLFEMRFERQIPRSPEKVWAALTIPERLAAWFGEAVEIDLRVGGKYLVMFPGGDDNLVEGTIIACEAARLLAFEWFGAHGNTIIRWELTPRDGGCHLVFHETGLNAWWFLGRGAGWAGFVDDLAAAACDREATDEAPGHHPREVERYGAMYGAFVPGFDQPTPLRHNEAPGFVTEAGDGRYNIRYVRRWRLPIERVWAAITEPERLADWLAVSTIDLRVGGGVELRWPTSHAVARYTIRELDPPRRMVWASVDPDNPESELRWSLYQEHPDIGVRLVFTQTLLPAKDLLSIATGWDVHLHELPEAALRDAPRPWSAERETARAARELAQTVPLYRSRLARDAPDAVQEREMGKASSAERYGEIRKVGDSYEIVFQRRLKKPIEKVWAALTVPERIADWFAEMSFVPEARLGARVELRFDDPPYQIATGEVVAFEPPRLFAWTWPDPDHPDSVVRCELVPDGDGCILTFSQSGMAVRHLTGTASGWHVFLEGLEGAAEGIRTPGSMERERALRPAYEAQLAALE